MRVQALDQAEVTSDGVAGDRAFFFVDSKAALISFTRLGRLATVVPDYDRAAGRLALVFPDGEIVAGPVEADDPETVTFFGEPVQARPVGGPFSQAVSEHCDAELRLMARPERRPATDRGRLGGVTMLGSGSLSKLEQAAADGGEPGPIDHRRFRMTFGLDGLDAHEEDDWLGRSVRIGGAEVRVEGMAGRCAATTRDPDRGNVDLKTLHHLASYRSDVPSQESLPFGVFASVTRQGMVQLGDSVEVTSVSSAAAP